MAAGGLKGNAPGFGGWERFEGEGIGLIVVRGEVEVKRTVSFYLTGGLIM